VTTEDPAPELHVMKWIFPRDLEENQIIIISVLGGSVCPYFDYHGDGRSNLCTFYKGRVQRVVGENGDLIAVQIGFYMIPDFLLDHPRVTAMVEP
jgi:hypothetical protein